MGLKLGLGLWLTGLTMASMAHAQAPTTTTVQGTVYLANGHASSGTLFVSWPAFTTAGGQAVAADSTTVTIAADGFVSVNLVPNLGSTPAGLYYTAVYYLSDGTTNTQYWVVPAAAQASLAQVQAQLMPAVQAVKAVDKAYVDQAIAAAGLSQLTATGGTLTGPLYLSGDPTQPLQAADKHYVDTTFSQAVPLSGGNMTGALIAPSVNGVESPVAGSSQPTLQTAMTAAGTNGAVEIPPTYAGSDGFTNPNGVYVNDLRPNRAQQIERSVKEFGAVCDGVTDDTNALQAALNYALAHRVALTIPQGACKTRSLYWVGQSIGGLGKQVSALMGFPGQDVLASGTDTMNMQSFTRIHDLTIFVDQSLDVSCSPGEGRAPAGSCGVGRLIENNSIFSPGGSGLTGTAGTGAGWSVGNCAIAMPAALGTGGNGLRTAVIENVEIAATGVDPMAAQYPGAHSTHTCGLYLAQWPQWSEFRNIDIRGLNTGIAVPGLPVATPSGLNSDSNRWENIAIQATHGFLAAAGSNNVLDNVVAEVGNSAATNEPPTGLVLDLSSTQQGWTVRNTVVLPAWNAVEPQLTVTAAGGAVTAVTVGTEHGLGFDPYGAQVPLTFSGSCTATATASVNSNGSIGTIAVTSGGAGCSGTTTASLNAAGAWDTAAPVNLIAGQNMRFFDGNLLKGNGGYTVWNAAASGSYGTQLGGGGGTLPGGGSYQALVANNPIGSAYQVDQFPGADFGAKLQGCLSAVSASYGGTCDAHNFTGTLSMGSNLTVSKANVTVQLPCATISTASQVIVTAGTRNVVLRGCALRGASTASGSQGGTVFMYSGTASMIQVGDPTYATDTLGFHLDNIVINTTASSAATTKGLIAYRTQEMDLESLYFLGNQNQTGMTLDGTGNYTGGTFFDNAFNGFGTAVNAIGHQISNAATTDWLNASTFVRLHIDCPQSGGNPIAGTYGIDLQQGDGNTFTGGDVEGCSTALHLGVNARNNTIVGLRNEGSTNQVVADAGSAYNNWMTGGTMFTGALTDNGTRNSFLDTFHRSFNGLNGDWYGSQKDATVTNHYRIGIGLGNERGMLNRYQTDYGYRWTMGLSDATAGAQFYQILDELNSVYRFSIGQYNNGQSSTNNQTVINAAGTGAIVLNGSNNSGTGGVVIGSGGPSETTVATISSAGNAQFNGTLQVGGASTFAATPMVKNQADAEIDATLWAGLTTGQKESFIYKDWNGNSQWYMEKDASNNWMLNSATGGLDSFKAYQSTNSGDTYINASNSSGAVRVNYETGSGTSFGIYGGGSSTLYASFTGSNAIRFPGLAASGGMNCLQVDNSGFISNTGSACGSGSGSGSGSGTVGSGSSGQIAYYAANGTTIGGINTVALTAGGTGASTAAGALANLNGQPALGYSPLNPANNLGDVSSVTVARANLGAEPISLTGSGAPSLACSGSSNSGAFYTSAALGLYQCSNVTGTYAWNAVGGASGGSAGVSSLNSLSGAVNVVGGTGISITPSGNSITIGNTGSGAAGVYYNVLSYGAVADQMPFRTYVQGTLNSGSNVLYVPSGAFTSADAGKYIVFWGWTLQPFSTTPSVAQIVSVTNSTTLVLSKAAVNTTNAYITWGTDNVPAFNACAAAVVAAGGGTCAIPAGGYLLATSPYYVLTGASDDGSYGTPAGGSGAVITPTLSGGTSGSITGWTVNNGGSLYTPNSTLPVNISGGCANGYDMGPCGWAFATASTNGSGQVVSVTNVDGGFFNSVPTGSVAPLGGDGAAATATIGAGTMNAPALTAGGAGYAPTSTLSWYALAGNSGCAGWQNWGGTQVVAAGSVATNASGSASGTMSVSHNATGCTSVPAIVFGSVACNTGTIASPVWGQCSNVAPLNPVALPVQVMLTPGVSFAGMTGASLQGVGLTSVWDGISVDNNEPIMFGGTVQSEDIGGINFGGGFIGILATNNANYSKLHDLGFNTGIGMWTAATDIGFVADNLSFGGYASWINGGAWSHRMDAPAGDGGFFDANSVSNILTRVNTYGGSGSVSQKLDDWFNEDFWRAEYSGASTDFFESCKYPQTLSQRQTSHTFFEAQQANGVCYRGISSIGMAILARDSRPTGAATFTNLIVKQASRYLFYGDLGGMTITNMSGEAMTPITGSNDPYRSATTQEGAVVFAGGASSAGNTQATLNGIYWTSPSSNILQCLWSLNGGGSAAGNPSTTSYSNNECSNVANGQPGQNPSFQSPINFNQGAVIGAVNGNTYPLGFNAWYSNASHRSGGIMGEYNGLAVLGSDLATHYLDIQYGAIASSQPFSAPSLRDTGAASGSGTWCLQIDTSGLISNTGGACGSGGGGGGSVSSFASPSGSWPSWLVPTVTNANSNPSLAVAASLTMANVGAGTAPAGTFVFPGAITAATTNSVVNAAEFSGSDCGAKINSADSSLGSTGGEIDVNQACGTIWTTQAVLSANHNLVFTQTGTYVVAGITVSGSNIIDLRGAELQMPAYTYGPTAGMFTTYNGTTASSNVWIENGTLDGNSANTPSPNTCLSNTCRAGVSIDNGGNSTAVHDIHIQNVTFQNWASNPIALGPSGSPVFLHFPFPYNIYVDGSRFINNGANNIYSAGWDHNLSITNNYFTGWGTGLTSSHANPITTIDFTTYPGTSQFGLNVTGNKFLASLVQPDGFDFAGELGAGGAGWITNFTWENNHMLDGGTGDGPCLSGVFLNGTIVGNVSTSWGMCEITGSNIAITGNTLQNGQISLNPGNGLYSTGNSITGNTVSINNSWGPYNNPGGSGEDGITIGGSGLKTITLTQAIRQTAQTFNVSGDSLAFTPQTSSGTPPLVMITGTFSGGASNGFQNWAFTLGGASTTQGAKNLGNNGTFICYSSTATTMSFVNPLGVSETLPTGAQLSSSANTTAYVGTYFSTSLGLYYGGFNGWVGQPAIGTAGFANAGNNATAATATATAYSASGGTLTISIPNSFVASQAVTIIAPVPTDALYPLNGNTYGVLSTGLSTSQIEITTSSVTGSGSTSAQIRGLGFTAIASSTTVLAVANANGVNETAAATMNLAPAIANSVVSSNDVSLLETVNGNCIGIFVGQSDTVKGTFYNLQVNDNMVTSLGPSSCVGIWFAAAGSPMAQSWGLNIKGNVLSNIGIAIRGDPLPTNGINDVTIENNKMSNVGTPTFNATTPSVYRQWNNVTSATQTAETLNGGATVDASGDISSPGWVSGGVFTPYPASGAVAWSAAVAVNVITLAGNITSSTIANGAFAGQQVCFAITQGSSVYSIVWPANLQGMSQPSQSAYYATYQCAVYLAAGSNWQALAPAIDGLGTAYLPGTVNAPTMIDRGLTSASLIGTDSSGTLVAATAHGTAVAWACADTSGSATAQSCATSPSFTPASGDEILYSTTTSNTGDVTVNVNSLGAKHIRKWSGSSPLASGDLVANVPVALIYDGTYWEIPTIGNAPSSGGGSVTSLAAPSASWPSWLVPTVTNASSTPSLAVAASSTGTGNVVLANGPTFTGNTTTFSNGAAAEQDVTIQPGTGADQVGAFAFNSYAGASEWKLRKDTSNSLKFTDVVNSLDRGVFYQNGQTLINSGAGANALLINGSTGSGTGGLLVENGGSSPSAVLTVSGSGNATATGFVSGKFMMGTGTMGLGAGAAAGTSPTIACASGHVCDGLSGTVTLTTGTSTTTGTLATLSFPNTHSNSANCVVTPTLSGAGLVTSISWSESTTALTLTANTALTASTAYQVRYWCGGN
jgi:hypothetical protein